MLGSRIKYRCKPSKPDFLGRSLLVISLGSLMFVVLLEFPISFEVVMASYIRLENYPCLLPIQILAQNSLEYSLVIFIIYFISVIMFPFHSKYHLWYFFLKKKVLLGIYLFYNFSWSIPHPTPRSPSRWQGVRARLCPSRRSRIGMRRRPYRLRSIWIWILDWLLTSCVALSVLLKLPEAWLSLKMEKPFFIVR